MTPKPISAYDPNADLQTFFLAIIYKLEVFYRKKIKPRSHASFPQIYQAKYGKLSHSFLFRADVL
jgi:hypothetical protein